MRRRLAAVAVVAALFVVACATEDAFLANRESAMANARVDSGCAEPLATDILNPTDVGIGGNRVRDATVVVTGCGKVMKYRTTCEKTVVAKGCQTKAEGEVTPPPPAPEAAPATP